MIADTTAYCHLEVLSRSALSCEGNFGLDSLAWDKHTKGLQLRGVEGHERCVAFPVTRRPSATKPLLNPCSARVRIRA